MIECAGAYGFAMGSNYNSKPLAAEVLIRAGQAAPGAAGGNRSRISPAANRFRRPSKASAGQARRLNVESPADAHQCSTTSSRGDIRADVIVGLGAVGGFQQLAIPIEFLAAGAVRNVAQQDGFGQRAGVVEIAGRGLARLAGANPFLVMPDRAGNRLAAASRR